MKFSRQAFVRQIDVERGGVKADEGCVGHALTAGLSRQILDGNQLVVKRLPPAMRRSFARNLELC